MAAEKQAQAAAGAEATETTSLLEQAITATRQTERSRAEELLKTLTTEALKGTVTFDKDVTRSLTASIKAIDAAISKQLAAVMPADVAEVHLGADAPGESQGGGRSTARERHRGRQPEDDEHGSPGRRGALVLMGLPQPDHQHGEPCRGVGDPALPLVPVRHPRAHAGPPAG